MTDLGTLPGTDSSDAVSVKERSQVVGIARGPNRLIRAFLWENGTRIDLGTPGGDQTSALAINERGQVVGYNRTASGEFRAVLWTKPDEKENARSTWGVRKFRQLGTLP